jgi:hypothetical protein
MTMDIEGTVKVLIESLTASIDHGGGIYNMSASVYDTPWVAMLEKREGGQISPLFPECFQYLLDMQLSDGSWESCASKFDDILNTMAAVLALKRRCSSAGDSLKAELEERCFRTQNALKCMVQDVDVSAYERIALEIIVPALLRLLEQEVV